MKSTELLLYMPRGSIIAQASVLLLYQNQLPQLLQYFLTVCMHMDDACMESSHEPNTIT